MRTEGLHKRYGQIEAVAGLDITDSLTGAG